MPCPECGGSGIVHCREGERPDGRPEHSREATPEPAPPVHAVDKAGPMKVEEIAEAVAKLPPDQLARFRRWFTAFEAGRTDHAEELDSTATKLGRLAGRAFAELKKRAKEPRE
jgi:hypothetical protein